MPTIVIMPKVDMDQEEATIISWLKGEGDQVKQDETILTVETEKVAIDIPSPETGTLYGIKFKAGDVVPVATEIAYILKPGEVLESQPAKPKPEPTQDKAQKPQSVPSAPIENAVPASPLAARAANALGVDIKLVPASGNRISKEDVEAYASSLAQASQTTQPGSDKIAATPAARRIARETGIPLDAINGSGPFGRIQAGDIQTAKPALPQSGTAGERKADIIPFVGMRKKIGERLQRSFNESPHIFEAIEADISQLEILRKRLNQYSERNGSVKISMTAILVKIIAWALERNPYINSSLDGENIHLWKNINVGVATAIDSGLIVPVVHDANLHSISQIAARIQDTSTRAKSGSLGLSDVTHGTFTVSNLGMFGIHQFRAIINPPESAILAVGTVIRKPVVVDEKDTVEVRPMMNFTLSADHRVIDGVVAAKFLTDLAAGIEAPSLLLF